MPIRTDTTDFLPTRGLGFDKHDNTKPSPVRVQPYPFDRQPSNPLITPLSPPPVSKAARLKPQDSHSRLRSDSGLAFHTNQAAFRQYTEYNPDGSVPDRPASGRTRPWSLDGNSSPEDSPGTETSTGDKARVSRSKVLPRFFDPGVVKLAFANPTTEQKLRKFAESRHGAADMEFLQKADEYSRALGSMVSLMTCISANFTNTAATSPLRLPSEVGSSLKYKTKYCARAALPALDKLYDDAKAAVEDRLAEELYPEFLKYQLTQCLLASLSKTRPHTGEFVSAYPGLGNAFCITDPLEPDNPVTYASDGLLAMSGYERSDVINKNCRLFQGVATDANAARRLSEAVCLGREATELVLNYRPDGTPFWNLLFICPLIENGCLRYFLGAQINVSESMGTEYQDVLDILNFGPPPEEFHPPVAAIPEGLPEPEVPSYPASIPEGLPAPEVPSHPEHEHDHSSDDQHSTKRMSRRQRLLRRFHRKKSSSSCGTSPSRPSNSRPSTSSETLFDDTTPFHDRPYSTRPYSTRTPPLPSPNEHSTPYSHFLVMKFTPPSATDSPSLHHHPKTPKLPISFLSTATLSLLNLHPHESHTILGRDIFSVLAADLASPSINRAFKASVTEKLARGEAVMVDLMVPAHSAAAHVHVHGSTGANSTWSFSGTTEKEKERESPRPGVVRHVRSASAAVRLEGARDGEDGGHGNGNGNGHHGERQRLSEALDRGLFSQVIFRPGRMKRTVGCWVPLRDGEGKVGWVVLVLVPVEGR